jgi:hypothetical protein
VVVQPVLDSSVCFIPSAMTCPLLTITSLERNMYLAEGWHLSCYTMGISSSFRKIEFCASRL